MPDEKHPVVSLHPFKLRNVVFQIHIARFRFHLNERSFLRRRQQKLDIDRLIVGGIVTNGGVASTVRDAHVRDIEAIVLEDGCAAFTSEVHATAIAALKPVAAIASIAEVLAGLGDPA